MTGRSGFVNLHTHTIYSQLDGLSKPRELVDYAVELGMDALGFTDHGNIQGWLDFYDCCLLDEKGQPRERPVKPILGTELYQARKTRFDRDDEERASARGNDDLGQHGPYHLTALARNHDGYRNLIRLSSRAYLEGYYVKPRVDHQLLAEHGNGLILLSGCLNGELQQALQRNDPQYALNAAARMQDMVGKENFYVEIQDHGIEEQRQVAQGTIEIARKLNAPIVPTGDCHYTRKHDSLVHDVMLCVGTKATVTQDTRFRFKPEEFYLKSYDDMLRRFPAEWLANTIEIAEKVNLDLKFGELYFPDYPLPPGETVDTYLNKLVEEGLRERYGNALPDKVRERADYELRVVRKMGFQSYFLVVWDLIKWCREQGIRTGWGRGSAAGSILSYALRITKLEPLRFGLMFERFLVEGRKSMPDIDLDIDDRYRERVIEYARQKYGDERVAHICTFSFEKTRSAIRDSARVLDKPYELGDRLAKLVPPDVLGISKTISEALQSPDLLKQYESDPEAREVIDAARGIEGVIRQDGLHAAGVVIAKAPIIEFVPVLQKGADKPVVTQWDDETVERNGLLKIDFLALRTLAVLDRCIENIQVTKGIRIEEDDISVDDRLTYDGLSSGLVNGVFQLESAGMREMAMAIQPNVIEDIMAIISLYRPGPMGSGMDKAYIARKHGRAEVEYDHPKLREILEDSYGIMLYQEDVLAVARLLAGFSPGEADDLRKAIGKKQMDKIGTFEGMFVEGCAQTSKVDPRVSKKIYGDIKYFGGYGFNRAHAASYAMLSYFTAYFKYNYPVEFMAGLLSSLSSKDKASTYLNECRRMGIEVRPPSINLSNAEYRVISDKQILFGLMSIDGIGPAVVNNVLSSRSEQPYSSVYDFMRRIHPDVLNKLAIEHFVHSGALDELAPEQPLRMLSREEKMRLLDIEREELGLYVSDHPLLGVWPVLEPLTDATIEGLEVRNGEVVSIAGLISSVNKRTTKNGHKMATLVVEDMSETIDVLAFNKTLEQYSDAMKVGEIVVVTGRVQVDGDGENPVAKIFLNSMHKPEIPRYGMGEPIVIPFLEPPSHGIITSIEDLIERTPGDSPVYIQYQEGRHTISLRFKKPTSLLIKENLELISLKERINVSE